MKTFYQLSEQIADIVKSHFCTWESDSAKITEVINEYIDKQLWTGNTGEMLKRARYPAYVGCSLRQTAHAVRHLLQRDLIIFGYWYRGEFYTTSSDTGTHKTTDDLRKILPCQAWGDNPDITHGMFYRGSLKPYFVS